MTDFKSLLRALTDKGVEFILVGGAAATVHGASRITQDLDVVYSRSPENIAKLISALEPLSPYLRGAPPGLPFSWSVRTLQMGLNFTLTTTLGDIDILGEITGGGDFEKLAPHCIEVAPFGIRCACLDLITLIRVKRAAGRPKDLEAIAELEAILEEKREGGR